MSTQAPTRTRPIRISSLAAYAVVRVAVDDEFVSWGPCPCGCGRVKLRTIGARGLRAYAGCARLVGEA